MPEDRRRAPLSSELAQRVVDLIAPTISHNINVMDEHGTIIACLDPSRVGTLHRGAQRVIAERRSVLVTTPESGTSDRPGANEPLFIDGELHGVVGVTGSPHEVEPLARVVALTVQLLIAQENEQDAVSRRHTEARDLIAALSSGTTRADDARARLAVAGLKPPWSLALWTAGSPRPDGGASPPPSAETTVARVNGNGARRAAVLHGALWVIGAGRTPAPSPDGSWPPVESRHAQTPLTNDVETLLSHAEELRALCRYAGLLPLLEDGVRWSREIAVAVAHLPRRSLARMAVRVASLTQGQRRTVSAMATAGSMREAADAMFVHRNTLLQRVERIRATTGLDIRRPDHLTTLHMCLYAEAALGISHIPPG
ncbi:sugar diacid recognition domain-containing protein [Nocardiopsis sp. MG754419]|uniref:CdaR family transcriptional regulator n=1 Tax=Nocardiopsis sp. MG754419 TaxID=2259865 RepID=UPI001BAB8A54|nr:sugar diacid recognition domain-containing protein [Nocardiopsis sp. MG754419]MBR8742625.1 sugar diacid recognition family protein [Nocardiopsis sp. MG754419]